MSDLVGQTLAHFRIVEKLGQGGMGVVYKATDEKLRRTVALKVLPTGFAADDERRRRFLREARSAAAVAHASIATVYDVGEADGRIYIAMELVEGKTLRARLEASPLTIADSLRIARDIARGLAKAYEKGVVHRDLKPDNVMVNDDFEVKILDFGLAKLREANEELSKSALGDAQTASHVTQEGTVLGTPGYMSPEQATGRAIDHRSDIFSLGVVLYEMVTGTLPFEGESPMEIAIAITRDVPKAASKLNESVSPELDHIIETCLAKKPTDRYATPRELLAALDAILVSDSGKSAMSSSGAKPSASRARGKLVALAAVAAVAVAVGAYVLRGPREVPLATTSASASASAAPSSSGFRAVTDLPLPASQNAEAIAAYKAGLQSFRDGSRAARRNFDLALKLDPTMAAAHLRLALVALVNVDTAESVARGRAHHQAATAARATLSPHDQTLLEAIEPMFRPKFQAKDAEERLLAALALTPDDVELLYYTGVARFWRGDYDGAIAVLARATEIDRAFGTAWFRKAQALGQADRLDEAVATFEHCIDALPNATSCLAGLAFSLAKLGQCARVEEISRRLIALDASEPLYPTRLAEALAAQGRPDEAVKSALRQADALWPEAERGRRSLESAFAFDLLHADFVSAEKRFPELEKTLGENAARSTRLELAIELVEVQLEAGRLPDAAKTARAYLRAAEGWAPDPRPGGATLLLLAAERRGRLITDAEFSRARDEDLASGRADMMATAGNPRGIQGGSPWIDGYAHSVETRAEAEAALAVLPLFLPLPSRHIRTATDDRAIGAAFVLAARPDEAVPYLEHAVRMCLVFSEPVAQTQSSYWLGQALEQKHDTAGACAAYSTVLARWGNAKPKSVTADLVRARLRALACAK